MTLVDDKIWANSNSIPTIQKSSASEMTMDWHVSLEHSTTNMATAQWQRYRFVLKKGRHSPQIL